MNYAINLILFSAAFWVIYQLLLKRETFFTANRVYLLVVPVLAVVLPLLSFAVFQFGRLELPVFRLPVAEVGHYGAALRPAEKTFTIGVDSWSLGLVLTVIYTLGIIIILGLLLVKLRTLQKLRATGKTGHFKNHCDFFHGRIRRSV